MQEQNFHVPTAKEDLTIYDGDRVSVTVHELQSGSLIGKVTTGLTLLAQFLEAGNRLPADQAKAVRSWLHVCFYNKGKTKLHFQTAQALYTVTML